MLFVMRARLELNREFIEKKVKLKNFNLAKLLNLYSNKSARLIMRLILIFMSVTIFLFLIPFYPIVMALLFGISLAVVGLRYPRCALFLAVLLSIPAVVYQENLENPVLIAYLFICIFLMSAIRVRWVDGAFVLLSLGLAFIPHLCFLAFVPILIAGLAFSPQDGAVVGLCASSAILLFLIIGAPNMTIISDNGRQAGLISVSASSSTQNLFQKQPILNFQPISLFEVFKNYVVGDTATHWMKAFIFAGSMLEKFLYDMNLWILPALWCVSGYLASKAVQWYSKIVKLPHLFACVTATVFPIIGYLLSTPSINPYIIFGAVTAPVLIGFLATPIYFQTQMTKLQGQRLELKAKLEKITANISKMSELGYNIRPTEKRLEQIQTKMEDQSVMELFQNKKFHKASIILKELADEALKLEDECSKHLNKIAHIEDTIRSVQNNVEEIKSTIRKTEKLFQPITMSEEKKELEEIQKRLHETTNMAKKGYLEEALNRLEELKIKSQTLDDEVSEIYEFWSQAPQWSRTIEDKLAAEGKVDVKTISEIPDKWKSHAVNYFLKERGDQELTLKNGIIYSSKGIAQPQTETQTVKMRITKPVLTEETDEKVFKYIQEHQGTISIKKALEDLKLSEEEFKASIKRLKEKRLIE
jgi:hypothetical protein